MIEKLTHCDKCGSKINNGRCDCGQWVDDYTQVPFMKLLEQCIYGYDHECEQSGSNGPMSGDHHSGNCFVFFKGDYELCMKVKDFIKRETEK